MLMQPTSDTERPGFRTPVDLRFAAGSRDLPCFVAESEGRRLVLTPGRRGGAPTDPPPESGDRATITWRERDVRHELPVEFLGRESAGTQQWHFRLVGPPRSEQRRDAVRAALRLPLRLAWDGGQLTGTTTDVSESGVRCARMPAPVPVRAGQLLDVTLELDDAAPLVAAARVVREEGPSEGFSVLVLAFVDLAADRQDRIRRRVFAELRAQRAGRLA
jgi:c-di-GMP-binding flagellar brake protein YcgR